MGKCLLRWTKVSFEVFRLLILPWLSVHDSFFFSSNYKNSNEHLKSTEKHKQKVKITHNHHVETTTLITLLIAHFTSMQLNKFMDGSPTPGAYFPEFRSSHIICTQPAFGWPEISANEHSYLQCSQMFLLMTMGPHKFLKGSYESWIQSFIAESDLRECLHMAPVLPPLRCWHD